MRRINLNLASHPLRNRRPFFFLAGSLALGILVLTFLCGFFFFRYYVKGRSVRASLTKIEASILSARREQTASFAKSREASKRDKAIVDLVNSAILKKTFSWTELFTLLETSLPDSSYILSLDPTLVKDTAVQFRFKVVSRNLDDLVAFFNNLETQKFGQIRVESEERNERGQLVSEITMTYERII